MSPSIESRIDHTTTTLATPYPFLMGDKKIAKQNNRERVGTDPDRVSEEGVRGHVARGRREKLERRDSEASPSQSE
jgi:hypothetical protein